ncbi:MAG: hypothetical protein ABSB33_08875 [Tepidisphaeraceae bacterium]|jgi:hypothetical protein
MGDYIKRTKSFTATDPAGAEYTIHEFTKFIDVGTRDGAHHEPGFKSLQTSRGQAVNYVSKGRYKLVFPEIELTSDDPDAP